MLVAFGVPGWRHAELVSLVLVGQVTETSNKSSRKSLVRCAASGTAAEFSASRGAGMGGVSGRSEFADYRAIGKGVAITPSVSVVISAIRTKHVALSMFSARSLTGGEVVVVDGHSVDDTIAVAEKLLPEVHIVHQEGRRKGDALQAGNAAAKGEIIVMMDADLSTDGGEILCFVAGLTTGADFARGSRFSSGGSDGITFSRHLDNKVMSGLVNIFFGS